jgi:hypothetical protein
MALGPFKTGEFRPGLIDSLPVPSKKSKKKTATIAD